MKHTGQGLTVLASEDKQIRYQFHQHSMSGNCASRFLLILLGHFVDHTAYKLGVTLVEHSGKVWHSFVGEIEVERHTDKSCV